MPTTSQVRRAGEVGLYLFTAIFRLPQRTRWTRPHAGRRSLSSSFGSWRVRGPCDEAVHAPPWCGPSPPSPKQVLHSRADLGFVGIAGNFEEVLVFLFAEAVTLLGEHQRALDDLLRSHESAF